MTTEIPQIVFRRRAWEKISKTTTEFRGVETGGMLLGSVRSSETGRVLIVDYATGPGPGARCNPGGFSPDIEYYRRMRRRFSDMTYLGEWHKHPPGNPDFSSRDLAQAREIIEREEIPEIICPISFSEEMRPGVDRVRMRCFYASPALDVPVPVSWSIGAEEPGDRSPLRYMAIEDRVARRFLASGRPYRTVGADVYRRVAHVFSRPLQDRHNAVLVNTELCEDFDMPAGVSVAVALTPAGSRGKFSARGYDVRGAEERALETEVVSLRHDQLQRNRSLHETAALRRCRVAVIGLGSVGGNAALELARAGVGNFTLIDPDTVSITNLCRHVCDLSDLGTLKTDAVAARISRIMPYVRLRKLSRDANRSPQSTLRACSDADAILVATDTENSRLLANWVAHRTGKPVIFAGLLERAVGGRVWRVLPGTTACYQCHPSTEEMKNRGPVAYSEVESERDITVEPGLGNDIAFVTHLAVRFLIDTLREHRKPELPYHMVFWFNHARKNWDVQPLTLYRVDDVPPRPDCPVCSKKSETIEINTERSQRC